MKYILPAFLIALLFLITTVQATENWSASFETQKVFIENKGQFNNLNNLPGSEVLFGTDKYSSMILFTKTGLTYRLEERIQPDKAERQRREKEMKEQMKNGKQINHKEMELAEQKPTIYKDFVQMEWVNANLNVVVKGVEAVSQYYNYGTISYVKAYSKIVYENLYPGIDVEYVFHPEGGIEYSFILHPGADASQIKMKYSDVSTIVADEKGNLHFPTLFGDIIEHTPQTFYANNNKSEISSKVTFNGTTVSFELGNYDHTQKVVIDPWVQSPAFNSQWDCVWEVEKDGAGNAYLIGGVTPMQLLKYNSAGALQWTYSTPYDTTSWLGTFAVDNAGNSYVTQGSLAAIQRISTAGALVWSNGSPGGIFGLTEFWSISFNCDHTKLVIGGTGGVFLPPLPFIYQVDMSNGNVTSSVQITGGALFPTQEVRSITACGNGKYYFLTHDSIGFINQNFGVCANNSDAVFYADNDYALGYKCENFRYNNTGIEAVKTYGGFVYVNRGNRLDKRDFNTGAILASVAIPGGAFSTQFGSSFNENSGIDIDVCGNIYVGSRNQVVKFNQSLSQLATYPTTFNVYDVEVSTGGNIIVGGSTGTSGSGARTGSIQQIAVGACAIVAITCCDASVCQAGPYCTSDAPVTLTASTPGGVWSGPGITNSVTGVFNPATAGQGTHYIIYTIGCGSDSIPIRVNICASLSACREQNGDITASGGTGPYNWFEQDTVQNCSSCIFGCAFPPGCAVTTYSWNQFSTGATATPPEFPVRVTDVNDNELIITNAGSLPACAACALTASASSTSATCGNSGGSATATASGATPTGYIWSNGATTATASNLSPGTYTVTITSTGCNATASTTVNSTGSVTATATSTNAGCISNGSATVTPGGGTGSFTYLWSNGGNTASISGLSGGTYTVTVTSGTCNTTASAIVGSTGSVTASATSTDAGCISNGTATATPNGGTGSYTYSWSNGGNTATISGLSGGTYTVTVTSGTCNTTASAVVSSTGGVSLSSSSVGATCGNINGSATVTVTAGTAPYTYAWSNGGNTATISNVAAGTYTVTVTGQGNCTATASVIVSQTGGVTTSVSFTNAGCSPSGSATVTPTGGNGTFTYQWSNGGTSATISNIAAGTYTVTVTSTGCTATATVNVTATGTVTASTSTTNAGCTTTGSATVTPSGGTGSFTYLWSTGGTAATISNIAGGVYTVTVTSGNCTATAVASVTSTGGVTLVASITHTTCGNNNGSISISTTTGTAPFTYTWSNGGSGSFISNIAAGTYSTTVTDGGGCSATLSSLVNSSTVNPALIVTNDSLVCSGDSTQICVTGAYVSYNWNTGQTTQCIYAKLAGNYYVTATDNSNCTASSNRIPISVYPLPPVSISVNGDTLTAYNAVTYQWYYNNVLIPGATSNIYIAPQSGDYSIVVTDTNGCRATSTKVSVIKTGIFNLGKEEVIKIYPNPLESGNWKLEVGNGLVGGEVEIFDDNGRLVYRFEIRHQKSEIPLDVASGVYMIRISSHATSVSHKLIKL